jgi:hypothetical protein
VPVTIFKQLKLTAMPFETKLLDKEFALSVGKMKIKHTTLFFTKSPDDAKDLVMQINITVTPDLIGPDTFKTENQHGVFKIGSDMFAANMPELFNTLVNDNQLNFTNDGLNIVTKGDKKEHEPLKRDIPELLRTDKEEKKEHYQEEAPNA